MQQGKSHMHLKDSAVRAERSNWTPEQREAFRNEKLAERENRIEDNKRRLDDKRAKGEITEEQYNDQNANLAKREEQLKKAKITKEERDSWTPEQRNAYAKERVSHSEDRLKEARTKLETRRQGEKISEEDYQEKLEKLNIA